MLQAKDIHGLYAIIPTPARPGAERLDAKDTVDLEATEAAVRRLIGDGVSGLIVLGTTGECATLADDDYRAFSACVLETAARRVPVLVGTSALGGHEIARRIRLVRDLGADGTLLGLPMWQPATTDMAVKFYAEVSRLFPDFAVMVYANARAFRYKFPPEFWEAVARQAPTVMSAKYSRPTDLAGLIDKTGGRIHFLPNESTVQNFYAAAPRTTTGCWATAAAMGPAPALAILDAIRRDDAQAVAAIAADIAWAHEPVKPIFGVPEVFGSYNIQAEKIRIDAAGYMKAGPIRPPYDVMPADYAEACRECGRRWARLCAKYAAPAAAAA